MGINERFFGWLRRTLSQRSIARDDVLSEGRRVELEDIHGRMRTLACVLFGDNIDVRTAEHDGGYHNGILWLPARFDIGRDTEQNTLAYVYRVAYAAVSLSRGYEYQGERTAEREALASLLAVRGTIEALEKEMPQAHLIRKEIAIELLKARPDLKSLPQRWAAIEGLHLALLGQPHQILAADLNPPTLDWLMHTASLFTEPNQLEAETTRVLLELDQLGSSSAKKQILGFDLWGRLPSKATSTPESSAGASETPTSSLATGTEKIAPPKEHIETIDIDDDAEEDSPFVHIFEKLMTAEEYQGGKKNLDGEDELDDHEEALSELDMRHAVRTRERANSLYRSDAYVDGSGADLIADDSTGYDFVYDEWDDRKQAYLEDWCRVNDQVAEPSIKPELAREHVTALRHRHHRAIRELRASFDEIERQRVWVPRQRDGGEIDIDAIVDRYADLRAAQDHGISTGEDRLYLSRRRRARDFATLILLDTSLSTDAWIDGRRVLDTARDSILILGEALGDNDLQVGVGAFHSNTRQSCQYLSVKGFREKWSSSIPRLLSLKPTGYTRIGPALRHATHLLSQTKAQRKLLLLISDGKPTDYDRYEGKHGIADVRQALREASRDGVHALALAVEKDARFYLPQMFGPHGYRILRDPNQLPDALARIHEQIRH